MIFDADDCCLTWQRLASKSGNACLEIAFRPSHTFSAMVLWEGPCSPRDSTRAPKFKRCKIGQSQLDVLIKCFGTDARLHGHMHTKP